MEEEEEEEEDEDEAIAQIACSCQKHRSLMHVAPPLAGFPITHPRMAVELAISICVFSSDWLSVASSGWNVVQFTSYRTPVPACPVRISVGGSLVVSRSHKQNSPVQ